MVNRKIISPLLYHQHLLSFSPITIIGFQTCLTLSSNLTLVYNLAFPYPTQRRLILNQPNQLLNSSFCFSLSGSHSYLYYFLVSYKSLGFRSTCSGYSGVGLLSDPQSLFSSYNGFS